MQLEPTHLALTLLLALGACHPSADPAPRPQPLGTPAPATTDPPASASAAVTQQPQLGPHRSPVSIKLLGPAQVRAGQDIELVAEIEQFAGSKAQVLLSLKLPEGARLVSGSALEQLPTENAQLVRRFVVHLDRVPATDIEVVARTQTSAFGARAQSAYRFGRPEPRFAAPPRSAQPLLVGGKDLGHPIQLHPAKP